MNRVAIVAFVALAACTSSGRDSKTPSNTTDDVIIRRHAPKIGARAHVVTTYKTKSNVVVRSADAPEARTLSIDVVETSTRDERVLFTDDFRPTRLEVTYVGKSHQQTDAQGTHVTDAPVAGKRYEVEARDGQILVLRDDETPAPDEERAAVADDYKVLLDPDPFTKDAFSKPIAVGKESPPIAAAVATLLHASNTNSVVSPARAVLLGTDGDGGDRAAVFQVEVAVSHMLGGKLPIRETLQLTGEWRLVVDGGWAARISIEGPTSYESADPQQLACEGEGEISIDLRRTYADGAKLR